MSEKTASKSAWIKAKRHCVTLPSGTVVEIELPNLSLLLKAGQIPNSLIETVTRVQNTGDFTVTPEMLKEQYDFTAFVVSKTVVNPTITVEDVDSLPSEDIEMLMDFAMRNRDVDILGHHIGGLETQADFRRFRSLGLSDEATESVA